MKNYRKSDYALNKFSEGIVYQFSNGIQVITMEDYLRDNPEKTESDFLALKAKSDEIYLEQVRLETAQGNKTVSLTELEDAIACSGPSLDESYILADDHRRIHLAVDKLFVCGKLTQKLILCLCSICANNFYGTGAFILKRVNPNAIEKDRCTYCGQRTGFDYEIRPKGRGGGK